MTVRGAALRWLAAAHGVRDGDILTSQFYPAARSWTGRDGWWVQVPVHRAEALGAGAFHVVCQAAPGGPPGGRDFHYLRVPAAYLRDNMAALDVAEDGRVVSLSLSAEPATLFRDERGAGRVPFGQFLRAAGAAG